jgi:Rod binding domain-containing protein
MSSPVSPLPIASAATAVSQTPTTGSAASVDPKRAAQLHTAAKAFESILVKQLLSAAKVGGQNPSGYADMAVDALATGVEKAGGLGLARRIEDTLSHSLSRSREPTGASPPLAGSGGGTGGVPGPAAAAGVTAGTTQGVGMLDEVGER